MSENLPLSVK